VRPAWPVVASMVALLAGCGADDGSEVGSELAARSTDSATQRAPDRPPPRPGSPEARAWRVVQRVQHALGEGDGRAACALLTATGRRYSGFEGASCEESVRRVGAGALVTPLTDERLAWVKLKASNKASVVMTPKTSGGALFIHGVWRERGRWRLAGIEFSRAR
jgi:hypothetical protein